MHNGNWHPSFSDRDCCHGQYLPIPFASFSSVYSLTLTIDCQNFNLSRFLKYNDKSSCRQFYSSMHNPSWQTLQMSLVEMMSPLRQGAHRFYTTSILLLHYIYSQIQHNKFYRNYSYYQDMSAQRIKRLKTETALHCISSDFQRLWCYWMTLSDYEKCYVTKN